MRKVWTYKRSGRKGVTVAWYEGGRQRSKALPTKALASHFTKIKYQQLNSDVFLASIGVAWDDACSEFLARYDVKGLAPATKQQASMFLKRFTAICRPNSTKSISQPMLDQYLTVRQSQKLSPYTVNKDIERINTLMAWLKSKRYHRGGLDITKLKTQPPKIRSLTDAQICGLLKAAPHVEWKLRIIFALSTGLRKLDLYRLPIADVDLDSAWVKTTEQKTGKQYSGPIPDDLINPLRQYLRARKPHRNQKQGANGYMFRVTAEKWLDKELRNFRPGNETMQSLRKTYATRIESTSISTTVLGHASKSTTRKFYNDMDYIKYVRVNQLPIKKWLDM